MSLSADAVVQSINKLFGWIDHSYIGWDPYDGLNSARLHGFRELPQVARIALVQIGRVSPLNLRPILSIEPGVDTKGISLFLQSYCRLSEHGVVGPLRDDGPYLFSTLMERGIKVDDTIAWGSHYFDYVGVDGSILTPDTPDLIGTTNAMKAICLYARHADFDVKDVVQRYYNFLLRNFDADCACYYYGHHVKNKYVPNCDAEVISSFRSTKAIVKSEEVEQQCRASLAKLIESQDEQGSWFYSYAYGGDVYRQLDFHQGFIIDGLIDALDLFPEMRSEIMRSLEKAVTSYDSLFTSEGRCYYRYPRRFPTDVHNQAQGIITYLKLYRALNKEAHLDMSAKICKWTIENMQDGDGYFYYQKGRVLTNRIPYMRWNQAWMMLALSQMLGATRSNSDPR